MNTDKERLKIALQILMDDLTMHKGWQHDQSCWNAVIEKLQEIQKFVNKMKE